MKSIVVRWVTYGLTQGVPRRSLSVALIVGTILNLINQGDVLFAGGEPNIAKILFIYSVPYFVATYGAVSFRLAAEETDWRSESATPPV